MLINFFFTLRKYKVPVTIRELLDLLLGLKSQLVYANLDDFYLLSRTALVKDEKNYDKFDRAFSAYFKGLDDLHGLLESLIPDEWLRHEFEKSLSPEDLKEIEGLGGLEKLIEAFKKAKEEAESKSGEEGKDGDEGEEKEGAEASVRELLCEEDGESMGTSANHTHHRSVAYHQRHIDVIIASS